MLSRGKVYSGGGVPGQLVGIGLDITDQKRNEEKLRHTQKLESLGMLAGGIAHDFNNLLVGIMGNASLASESLPVDHAVSAAGNRPSRSNGGPSHPPNGRLRR
jgi:hypothetical protein